MLLQGVEEIGVQIEEPFSILALEQICIANEGHLRSMMAMDDTIIARISAQVAAIKEQPVVAAPILSGTNGAGAHIQQVEAPQGA